MSNVPKFAIVAPCFNAEKYIADFISSMINQSFKDWRLYLVDDHSTDSTLDIIKKFAKTDDRIVLKSRERAPKGAQTCRNTGLEIADAAKYVCIFDSDDLLAPYCLEQRYDFMESNPDIDFGIFPAKRFFDDIYDNCKNVYGIKIFDDHILNSFFWDTLPFAVWTNCYRYDSIKKFSLVWDEEILSLQDSDFNIQSIVKGASFKFCETGRTDYFYRAGIQSSISTGIKSKEHLESHLYLLRKTFNDINHDKILLSQVETGLKQYHIWFSKWFITSKNEEMKEKFLNLPFIKTHKWYAKRLAILINVCKKRYSLALYNMMRLALFPIISIKSLIRKKSQHKAQARHIAIETGRA